MKHLLKRLIPLLLVAALIISVCWYVLVYDRATVKDFLMAQARSFAKNGHFDTATWLYDLSYQFAGDDETVAIDLAQLYRAAGNYTKAEYTLVNAIADRPTTELYVTLCDIYVEQDKLLDAANLLDHVTDPVIKAKLDGLRPKAPRPNFAPGFYSQYISLTFPQTEGKLYVTTDGEYPSVQDEPCTGPIALSGGETKLYAVTVGADGLVSPLSVLGYTVGGVVEEIVFADVLLEELVREELHYSEDAAIYTDALWTLRELTVPQDAIELTDLQHMIYLEKLTITNRRITDLSFLNGMTRLKELNLQGCELQCDYSILGTLPELETLNLQSCSISSLVFLKGAPMLKELNLSSNAVGNLSLLSTIPTLQVLDLHDNAVSDLSPLADLPQLRELNLSENLLTSLKSLEGNTALTYLNVSDNKLTSLAPLRALVNLTHLYAAKNQIADSAPLAECTQLQILDISSNRISDIASLYTLTKLLEFNFSTNAVTTLPSFPASSALVTIDGSYNQISSLSQLDHLDALNYVIMDYNEEISTIAFLADNPNMVQINVFGTKVPQAQADKCLDRSIIVHYDPT